MKNVALVACLLASLFVLTACTGTPKKADPAAKIVEKEQRMLVITSAEPVKVLPAFTTFSWDDDYSVILSATNDRVQQSAVKAYIREQLIAYLKTKGYQYQPVAMQADVVIGFLFALQDTPADKITQGKFGILPSNRNTYKPIYKQGTLLINVLDAQLQKAYWRSALLGFTDLEAQEKMHDQARMQVVLNSMLGGFPKAGR